MGINQIHYYGDRHPDIAESGFPESAFEDEPRPCKNCKVVARCMKEEHLTDMGTPEVVKRCLAAMKKKTPEGKRMDELFKNNGDALKFWKK